MSHKICTDYKETCVDSCKEPWHSLDYAGKVD